jgi:hypothetical protein
MFRDSTELIEARARCFHGSASDRRVGRARREEQSIVGHDHGHPAPARDNIARDAAAIVAPEKIGV